MSQSDQNFAETIAELAINQGMTTANPEALSLITVPCGFDAVNTEKYQLHRNRFRGEFQTESSDSFAKYVDDRGGADKCFVDNTNASAMLCKAIFNLGDEHQAGHADDIARLKLPITDEFYGLTHLGRCSQREIVDFIQDYAHCLEFYFEENEVGEADGMSFAHALKAFRSVTVKSASEMTSNVGDLSASKSALECIEADSAIKLPRLVEMRTSLYEDLPEVTIKARVSVITDGDSLAFSLRIVQKQKELNDAAGRFVDMMTDILPDNTPIYVGVFAP